MPKHHSGVTEKALAAQVTQRKREIMHGEQESAYLYGFLDPSVAARGPMRSEHPTIVANLSSTTTISLKAPTTEPTQYTHTAAQDGTTEYALTGTAGAATGDILIVAGPIAFADKLVGSANNAVDLYPGCVCTTATELDTAAFSINEFYKSGETATQPIGAYTCEFPGAVTMGTSGAFEVKKDGATEQAYRVLGVRATLTVNSSLLESYGQVYVSDNGTYWPDEAAENLVMANPITSGTEITNLPIIDSEGIYAKPFGHGQHTNRTINAGAFTYGSRYEGSFIPTNNIITKYRNRFPTHCRPEAGSTDGTDVGQPFLNGPFVLFALSGIPADSVVTLSTAVAFELPVRLDSPIGFLIASARLAMNYTVDWSLLACVPTGGTPGTQVMAAVTQPFGKLGFGMATGAYEEPREARPVNVGLTAPSPTVLVTSATRAEKAGADVQAALMSAAQAEPSSEQWYHRAGRHAVKATRTIAELMWERRRELAEVAALAAKTFGDAPLSRPPPGKKYATALVKDGQKWAHSRGLTLPDELAAGKYLDQVRKPQPPQIVWHPVLMSEPTKKAKTAQMASGYGKFMPGPPIPGGSAFGQVAAFGAQPTMADLVRGQKEGTQKKKSKALAKKKRK